MGERLYAIYVIYIAMSIRLLITSNHIGSINTWT